MTTQLPTSEGERLPSGIVVVRIAAGVRQTVADAVTNVALAVRLADGRRSPILVDISRCPPLEPEVRHLYTGQLLVDSFSALALLVEASPFGRMMGNVYLRLARLGVPTRLFSDEAASVAWLETFL